MKSKLEIERKILGWLIRRRFRVYVFAILGIFVWFSPLIPYLNIYSSYEFSTFFIIFLLLVLFDIQISLSFVIIVFLFLVCLFFQLVNQIERADLLGNYIFGIIFIELMKYLFNKNQDSKLK